MPDCTYCGASFDDEDAYLAHLEAEHEGELGPIDRRKVQGGSDGDGGFDVPTGPVVLTVVLLAGVGVVAFSLLGGGGGGGSGGGTVNGIAVETTPAATADHYHGTANVTVLGERIDFSQQRYQLQADAFHFEGGNGVVWHGHAQRVTLQYAMATLDINVTESTVTVDGTTYRDASDDYAVTVEVDGESVTPSDYVLQGASDQNPGEGDFIHIVVERTGGSQATDGTAATTDSTATAGTTATSG
jgi:hypothetical protein